MTYKATVISENGKITKTFPSISDAARWLDLESYRTEVTTMIEAYNDEGVKTEGFFYTEKAK